MPSIRGEFVRVTCEDGLELQGLYCPARNSEGTALIHVHGMAGNFYENRFIDFVGAWCESAGVDFITGNNRGHDYVADFLQHVNGGVEDRQIGSAFESFADCTLDIAAWISLARQRGAQRLVLQGHSLGVAKVLYYVWKEGGVDGLVLLSPVNVRDFQISFLGERFDDCMTAARKLVASGKGNALVPDDYFVYPMSAGTYVDLFAEGTMSNVVPSVRDDETLVDSFVDGPILAVLGDMDDFATSGEAESLLKRLGAVAGSGDQYTPRVVGGGVHNYFGREEALVGVLRDWSGWRAERKS